MLSEALGYPFFQRALLAGLLAGLACGVVGCYVVVKRMASISGGLAHAAFGGVGLGYLAGFDPLLGAAGFTLLSGAAIRVAAHRLGQTFDTLIAMFWSVGMALGILFMSLREGYAPDLMGYLFGSILFVSTRDLLVLAGLDLVIALTVVGLFMQLRAVTFDEEFADLVGLPVELLSQILMALTALAVVVLIRVVGVILVIALLTIPAAIARQWTNSLARMMVLATLVAVTCTTSGLLWSYNTRIPTGPLVVLVCAGAYGLSVLLGRLRQKGPPPLGDGPSSETD